MKLLSQQDYVKASIEFKNALQLKKDLVGAWRGLAQIEEHNQSWESLIAIRRTIVELDPKDIDARLRLARILVLANVMDEALNVVNGVEGWTAAMQALPDSRPSFFSSLMTTKGRFARHRRR